MISHHNYHQPLKAIYEKAVRQYQDGQRGSGTYFGSEELSFLDSIGQSAQEVYDFAEDAVNHGEPDYEVFLTLAGLRRYYFLNVMGGQKSSKVVDTGDLPPKSDSVRDIVWLPRIIAKARAKLRGEMSDDLMYGCGGDRKFFKTNDLHPAEFLLLVMQNFDNDEAIIDFVASRSKAAALNEAN